LSAAAPLLVRRRGKLFSEDLAHLGITITSGLAIGIDGVAHRGALEARGKTIGVLGNGLGAIYPRRHQALAGKIVESGGALLSEFPLSTSPGREISLVVIGLSADSVLACW
jgi:DNA processing protein